MVVVSTRSTTDIQLRDFNSTGPRRHRTTLRWSKNKHASCITSLSGDRQCYYVVCLRRLPLTGEHFLVGRARKTQRDEFAQAHMQSLSPLTSGSEVSTRVPTPNKVLGENRHAVLPPTRHLQVRPHRQLHIYAIVQPRFMCFASPPNHGPHKPEAIFSRASASPQLGPVPDPSGRRHFPILPAHLPIARPTRRLLISEEVPTGSPQIRSFRHVENLEVNTLYREGDEGLPRSNPRIIAHP